MKNVVFHVERDGAGTVVGVKVDGDLPADPGVVGNRGVDVAGRGVVGQDHATEEIRVVSVAGGQHVDTAIGRRAGCIGPDGFVESAVVGSLADGGKHRAVAVAVVADAEERAPPLAQHVAFDLDDAAFREVEAILGDVVGGDVAKARARGVREHA